MGAFLFVVGFRHGTCPLRESSKSENYGSVRFGPVMCTCLDTPPRPPPLDRCNLIGMCHVRTYTVKYVNQKSK